MTPRPPHSHASVIELSQPCCSKAVLKLSYYHWIKSVPSGTPNWGLQLLVNWWWWPQLTHSTAILTLVLILFLQVFRNPTLSFYLQPFTWSIYKLRLQDASAIPLPAWLQTHSLQFACFSLFSWEKKNITSGFLGLRRRFLAFCFSLLCLWFEREQVS